MLLFFAPTAFAASADVVLCMEFDGQASFERGVGEDCTSFAEQMPNSGSMATPQHCSECTDYVLSNSVYRTKATSAENSYKTPQKVFVAEQSLVIWPCLKVDLALAPTPHQASTTLTHLRTVIIRV